MDLEPMDKKLQHENIIAKFTNKVFVKLYANTERIWNQTLPQSVFIKKKASWHGSIWHSQLKDTDNKQTIVDLKQQLFAIVEFLHLLSQHIILIRTEKGKREKRR
jgi:hypothetical protein